MLARLHREPHARTGVLRRRCRDQHVPDQLKSGVMRVVLLRASGATNLRGVGPVQGAEREEGLVVDPRQDPALYDLYGDLDLGLVPEFSRTSRNHGGVVGLRTHPGAFAGAQRSTDARLFDRAVVSVTSSSIASRCGRYLGSPQYAEWKAARVNIDYPIEFEQHCYSVPFPLGTGTGRGPRHDAHAEDLPRRSPRGLSSAERQVGPQYGSCAHALG